MEGESEGGCVAVDFLVWHAVFPSCSAQNAVLPERRGWLHHTALQVDALRRLAGSRSRVSLPKCAPEESDSLADDHIT